MNNSKNNPSVFIWTARILTLVFAAFLSLFAMDVFAEGNDLGKTILDLIMHLIPTFLVLAILLLSWRWEWVGGIAFAALAVFHLVYFWGRLHWSAYAVIEIPLCIISVLFIMGWNKKRKFS